MSKQNECYKELVKTLKNCSVIVHRISDEKLKSLQNNLQELKPKTFCTKSSHNCRVIESASSVSKDIKQLKNRSILKRAKLSAKSAPKISNKSLKQKLKPKKVSFNDCPKQLVSPSKTLASVSQQMDTNIEIKAQESVEWLDCNESEEMDERHPLWRCETHRVWLDKKYQLDCLKNTIDMLKQDKDNQFKNWLHNRAVQTLNIPVLPNQPNLTPIIKFDLKKDPNFEFFLGSTQSPVDPQDVLQLDAEVIIRSQIIYECIQINNKRLTNPVTIKELDN